MSGALEAEASFVIHTRPYKEHSLLAELFTLNLGRVSVLCRSSRAGKSPGRALLQPFVPLKLALYQGRSTLYHLGDVSLCGEPFNLKLPQLFSGMYANELLYHLYRQEIASPKLFAAYLKLLQILSSGEDGVFSVLRAFELALLESLGLGLSFSCEGAPLDPGKRYRFSSDEGFKRVLGGGELLAGQYAGSELLAIADGDYEQPALRLLTHDILKELLAGRELKSRQLYADFLKRTGS